MKLPTSNVVARLTSTKLLTTFYILLTTFFLSSFLFANPVSAAISSGGLEDFQDVISSNEYNKESFDAQSTIGLFNTLSTAILGDIRNAPELDPNCETCAPQSNGGALNFMVGAIGAMYNLPPASGVQYVADIGQKLNLVQPAYAQGDPFQRVGGGFVLDVWRGFRNAAYVLFVVAFVAIGFAIMFRTNLNPQTVITIQSALPRIIIALLLVTFSYAIAGLLIDLLHVGTRLVDAVLFPIPNSPGIIQGITTLINSGLVPAVVFGIIAFAGGGAVAAIAGIGAAIITLILALLYLFAVFRLIWMYLMTYVGIILKIVFGPLTIIFNTLPGRPVFWGWFGALLADASVFATAYGVIRLGEMLSGNIWAFSPTGPNVPLYFPGNIVVGPLQLGLTGAFIALLKALLGLGIILMTPNIANAVKETIRRSTQLGEVAGFGTVRTQWERTYLPAITAPAARGAKAFGAGVLFPGGKAAPWLKKVVWPFKI